MTDTGRKVNSFGNNVEEKPEEPAALFLRKICLTRIALLVSFSVLIFPIEASSQLCQLRHGLLDDCMFNKMPDL